MVSTPVKVVLPIACAWAQWHESLICKFGVPLASAQLQVAKDIGISRPERVRLHAVPRVPPSNWLLRSIGERLGLVSGLTIGMTLRYGIYIQEAHWGERGLLVHELAHVVQYERLGGFQPFLARYLQECIDPGYPFGPLEQEAKAVESRFNLPNL